MGIANRYLGLVATACLAASTAAAGVPQKAGGKCDGCPTSVREHKCRHQHCHYCDAPFAPILGSAPAMMAPVIVQQQGTRPLPSEEPKPEDQLQQLKELLELLDDLTPEEATEPASAAPRNGSLDQSLQSLDTRLRALEDSQSQTLQGLVGAAKTVETLKETSRVLVEMKSQILEIQKRLDQLQPPKP